MSSAAQLKHDTPLAALAMFGAVALAIGIPQQFVSFDELQLMGAVIPAVVASIVGAVDREVSRTESALAAFLATIACASVDWRTGDLFPWSPLTMVIASVASAVLAFVWKGRDRRPSRLRNMIFALFIAGGVLAVLVLGGLAVHRATGWSLTTLPWLAGALSGAFLAWRVPSVRRTDACIGIFGALFVGGLAFMPRAPAELPPEAVLLIVFVGAFLMTAVGAFMHRHVTKRLARQPLPTARARDRA